MFDDDAPGTYMNNNTKPNSQPSTTITIPGRETYVRSFGLYSNRHIYDSSRFYENLKRKPTKRLAQVLNDRDKAMKLYLDKQNLVFAHKARSLINALKVLNGNVLFFFI